MYMSPCAVACPPLELGSSETMYFTPAQITLVEDLFYKIEKNVYRFLVRAIVLTIRTSTLRCSISDIKTRFQL